MEQQLTLDFDAEPERILHPDDIFERADEDLLRKLSENRCVERKSPRLSRSQLGENVCMWANTSPDGGVIVVGMEDNGNFSGCADLLPKQINNLEKAPHEFCPDAREKSRHVSVKNSKGKQDFVILFRVDYQSKFVVKTTSSKAFVRRGDSKYLLTPEEIRELQADKGEISFEQNDSNLLYPRDFDENAVAQFVAKAREDRDLPERLSTTEVVENRRLGSVKKLVSHFLDISCKRSQQVYFSDSLREATDGI